MSKRELKNAGLIRLEPTRGEQSRQKLKCAIHGTEFEGIPFLLVKRKQRYLLRCKECVTEAIDEGNPLIGYNFLAKENFWALKLRLKGGRFPSHTVIGTKNKKVVMRCSITGEDFLTEIGAETGQGKTGCAHCAEEVRSQKIKNINLAHVQRYASSNRNPLITYNELGKVCVAHGKKWRCGICSPFISIGEKRLGQVGLTPETTTLKKYKELLEVKREKTLARVLKQRGIIPENGVIRVCKHLEVSVETAIANPETTFCLKCEVIYPAYEKLKQLYPDLEVSKFRPVTAQKSVVTFNAQVENGSWLTFNSSTGKLRENGETYLTAANTLDGKDVKAMQRLTKQDFKARVVRKHPSIEVLGIKLDWSSGVPVKLKHDCGHTWVTKINNVLKSKVGCPECGRKQAGHNASLANLEKAQAKVDNKVGAGKFTVTGVVPSTNAAYKWTPKVSCNACTKEFVISGVLRCPRCSVSRRGSRSGICWEWLSNLERLLKIEIAGCNSKEVTVVVGGKRYRVDGFHRETKTVFEFLGDYWHGNPKSFPEWPDRYAETIERLTAIHKRYNVIYVWESAYKTDARSFSGFMSHAALPFLF